MSIESEVVEEFVRVCYDEERWENKREKEKSFVDYPDIK